MVGLNLGVFSFVESKNDQTVRLVSVVCIIEICLVVVSNIIKYLKKLLICGNLSIVPFSRELFLICGMATDNDYSQQQLHNLGKRLRALRIKRGYTNYEQFAFDHELPRAQYGRYEQGKDLRFSSLVKVLKALDVTLEEFFQEGFDEI